MRLTRAVPLRTTPTVSVVVPCHNYGHFLPDAVSSALDQPGLDLEVVVVDDASTDDSADVARRLAARDDRVRVLVHRANRGHIATYNDGLAEARGDYVVLLSADDLLTPGSLTRSVALLERHPAVTLAYGAPVSFTGTPPVPTTRVTGWSLWPGRTWLRRVCATARNPIVNPEAVLRRSVLDEVGGYDPRHPFAADLLLWMQAARRGDVGRVNGAHQALYRVHGQNMTTTDFAGVLTNQRTVHAAFEELFADGADDDLRRTARRAIATEAVREARMAQAAGDRATLDGLADLALTAYPSITGTRGWRALHRHPSGPASALERRVLTSSHALRWSARSRRWRLVGT
ncbi:glycosyltransferase family 2 protein [Nocardioides conyzicola]|uniref:Glycosyltransferase n=1 Tax=Nocardioides conyzicola TaxID=1651781 RepID=A0ABP8XNV7_9ACTN